MQLMDNPIQRGVVLGKEERKTLERRAHRGRMEFVEVSYENPLILLKVIHALRAMRDKGHSGYQVLAETIPINEAEKRDKFLETVSQMEEQLSKLIESIGTDASVDDARGGALAQVRKLSALARKMPARPAAVLSWGQEARSVGKEDVAKEFSSRAEKLVSEKGKKSTELLTLLARIPEITRTLLRLSDLNMRSKIQLPTQGRILMQLAGDTMTTRTAYEAVRSESAVGKKGGKMTLQNLSDVLGILEEQLLLHGMLRLGIDCREAATGQVANKEATIKEYSQGTHDLIVAHLSAVEAIAKRYSGLGVEYDELVQVGSLFLMRAARSHDPDRGQFTTYIWTALHGVMKQRIHDQTLVHMPLSARAQMQRVREALREYISQPVVVADPESMEIWISKKTHLTRKAVEISLYWLDKNWRKSVSLESYVRDTHLAQYPHREDDPEEIAEVEGHEWNYLKDTIPYPDDAEVPQLVEAESELLKEKIDQVLKTLTYREREILKLRYGLTDGYTYNLEEVGRIFKVTRERVRQIEAKAVRKMQHPVRARQLEPFLELHHPERSEEYLPRYVGEETALTDYPLALAHSRSERGDRAGVWEQMQNDMRMYEKGTPRELKPVPPSQAVSPPAEKISADVVSQTIEIQQPEPSAEIEEVQSQIRELQEKLLALQRQKPTT